MAKRTPLFGGGKAVIRKCGTYINEVNNTEIDIRTWIINNVAPPWDILDGNPGLSKAMTTRELLNIASDKKIEFVPA